MYCIETKNDEGRLLGVYVGICGITLTICAVFGRAIKFHDQKPAQLFMVWLSRDKNINLNNMEVTEHEEI